MQTHIRNAPEPLRALVVSTINAALRNRLVAEPDFLYELVYTRDGQPARWDLFMGNTATARADAILAMDRRRY